MFLRFALLVVLCVVVRADNPSVGRVGQSVNGLASLDFKSSATAHQALLKLIKQVDLKLPTDLKAIADDETTELEGDNNQLQHAGDYFIECHPTPIAKDEKSKKECEVWKDSLKSWPKFAKFIRLLDAPDEVDPKVSARHEKIAEQLHFKLHPNEKPQLEESDNAAEKAEAKAANQGQAGSGSLLQTEESLPLFERPENNGRWPKDRNVYPIAFCFARHPRAYQKAFFYKAMRLVRAVANNIRFRQVGCGAPGHKIKMLYSKGDCGTEASGYKGAGNPTAGTARARGKPSTSQYLECDRNFYNTWSGAHELFHALGFGHTQSRAGRDRYLDIRRRGDGGSADWQYRKIGNNRGLFDFDSVMLYPADSPGDPKPTAWPRNPTPIGYAGNPANMGQRSYISAEDARILNMVYN